VPVERRARRRRAAARLGLGAVRGRGPVRVRRPPPPLPAGAAADEAGHGGTLLPGPVRADAGPARALGRAGPADRAAIPDRAGRPARRRRPRAAGPAGPLAQSPRRLPGGPAVRTAKQTALSVTMTTGRMTSVARTLPSFLIMGAQRCGTTSMYRALAQHPLLHKPVLRKGVHYFDTGYWRGLQWYRAHFPMKVGVALLNRRFGGRPLAFESSPYYLFHPLAGERIAADLPGVKLLVLVRDPVERACSAHAHELARGFETEESFERALE